MRNSILKSIYHYYVCKRHSITSFRGGWMLTHVFWNDYKSCKISEIPSIMKAHRGGWSWFDYKICNIANKKHDNYLTNRDYCSLHPFNGLYSAWIDDKLTLKYILAGTKIDQYMPKYYFEITSNKNIIPLMDYIVGQEKCTPHDILYLLHNQKNRTLALKKNKASIGEGFIKLEYDITNNKYLLNNKEYSQKDTIDEIAGMSDYLVTEYFYPHPEFAKYNQKSVGCIRYNIGRDLSDEIIDIFSFIRLGTKKSGFVENYNAGGILCIIRDGQYDGGNIIDENNRNKHIAYHPDLQSIPLKGSIPQWNIIKEVAHNIAKTLPQLKYMGIDFCITRDNQIKILEINSLTSLDCMQVEKSIFDYPGGIFFKQLLSIKH